MSLSFCLLAAIVWVAAAGGWIAALFHGLPPDLQYGLPSAVLLLATLVLIVAWPESLHLGEAPAPAIRWPLTILLGGLGLWAWTAAVDRMLPIVFAGRIDAMQADMLVVIDRGVRRLASGANPYTIYKVPWDVPLPYGPYLWGPFALPIALHADPRMLTLLASLVVPGTCVWAAIDCVRRGSLIAAGLFLGLSASMLLHPAALQFFLIGHTPVYWPLLLIFAWLLRAERWTAAAVAAGSLVVARTTMASLVPVFMMFLWHRRLLTWGRVGVLGAAILIPFLPFLIADPGALWYALYGSYQKVMKEVVWPTKGAHTTFGVTGFLLRHGTERHVELAQAVGMTVVYASAWRALSRGARPEPWLLLALLTFSMTTLWPVVYLYFDGFTLLAAALASSVLAPVRPVRDLAAGLAVLVVAALVIVLWTAERHPGSSPIVDLGAASAVPFLERGFDPATPPADGDRTYRWVSTDTAVLRIPRASRSEAAIRVGARGPSDGGAHRVAVWLNGYPLGQSVLRSEWDNLAFRAPRRVWFYGVNTVELRFTSAPGSALGDGPPGPAGRAAIDFVKIER